MPDKSLDILIKTQAELQGAEAAAESLDKQITKAKETGKGYEELEKRLAALKQALAAKSAEISKAISEIQKYKTALDAAKQSQAEKTAAVEQAAAVTAKYKEELAELEQQVKNLDARENWVKNVAPQELAQAAERTARMSDATAAFTTVLNEEDQAQKELSKSVSTYTKEDLEELFGKTEKATKAKEQLKAAISGLTLEFPLLGRIARMAINPITFAVAAASAAFVIWRARTTELQNAFNSLELPNLTPPDPRPVSAAAKAWDDLTTSINKAHEAFSSSEGVYERAIKFIERQAEAQKKLLEANKALELSGAKTEAQKQEIETRYGQAGLNVEQNAQQQKLARLIEERLNLEQSAISKRNQAAKIQVASAEEDEKNEADLKAQAEAARKDLEERRKKRLQLIDYKNQPGEMSLADSLAVKGRLLATGLSVDELIALDEDQISRDRAPIDRYNQFVRRKPARERARKRRDELNAGAAEDAGKAEAIGLQLPNVANENVQDANLNQQVFDTQRRADLVAAQKEAQQKADELADQAIEALKSNGSVSAELARRIATAQADIESLKRQLGQQASRANVGVHH